MSSRIERSTMALALLLSAVVTSAASICVDESALRRSLVRTVASLATPSNDSLHQRAQPGVVSARETENERPLQRSFVSRARVAPAPLVRELPTRVCELEHRAMARPHRPVV